MRLDDKTREIIKSEVATQFGADTTVPLFGSRVDDTQRGGDIELLIETDRPLAHTSRRNVACQPGFNQGGRAQG